MLALSDGTRLAFDRVNGVVEARAGDAGMRLVGAVCARVVASGRGTAIPDLAAEPGPADGTLGFGTPLRACAAVPMTAADGEVLGTLCVCDTRPREWGAAELDALADLAALAADEARRRRAGAELTRTERLLRDSEGWFRSLVEQSIMAIYCYQDGHFRYVNPRFAEIFGYTVDKMQQPGALRQVVHPDDFTRVADNIRARLDGEIPTIRYTLRGIRSDGELCTWRCTAPAPPWRGAPR